MKILVLSSMVLVFFGVAQAQESGRIKRRPPTPAEVERQAIDMAKSDSLLRKGDIVATDRGFIVFRGLSEDGVTNDFAPVQIPFPKGKK